MLTLLSYVKRRHWAMIAHNTSPDFAGLAFGGEEVSGVYRHRLITLFAFQLLTQGVVKQTAASSGNTS